MKKTNKKFEKQTKVILMAVALLLIIIYSGTALYFKNHFYFGTTINDIKASGKTVNEIDKEITTEVKNYTLQLKGRKGTNEKITASDINMKCDVYDKISKYKKSQSPFNVLKGIFGTKKYNIGKSISYDENSLKKQIDSSSLFDENKVINPKDASLKYTDKGYEIQKEVYGNKLNKDLFYKKVVDALNNDKKTINLEESKCYENPKYTSKSKEVINAKNVINKYISSSITYTIGDNKEVLNSSTIKDLITVDNNFNVQVDKQKVKKYVTNLAYTYNTAGKTRDFINASGQSIKVSGGTYGWAINISKETDELVQAIKEGKTITKKPEYSRTAHAYGSDEIGNTYVEIDLTKQHLWFYKNGSLVIDGDVVTGNVSKNWSTPEGVYQINAKQKDFVLKGQDYNSPVSFWMPFNNGIGIHDSSWRAEYGKDFYLTRGSHGCVNSPYALAEGIYNNIEVGTPVVCHY